jgi:predicted O-methyltransferase YrrM
MADKTFLADPALYRYALEHSLREPEILRRLRQETASYPNSNMQISPDQGEFFALLIRAIGARKVLEVGVFTGYSSLAVMLNLPPDGRLIACDISEEYTKVARRYWKEAGVADRVELNIGPAVETLARLSEGGHKESFDFAFIDADKSSYDHYYEFALQLVRPGGLIALDNMLQSGKVIDATVTDRDTVAIRALNDKIAGDQRVIASLLPLADGITLALKK